jgi:hypothetical protein
MLDADHGVPASRSTADRNTYFLGSIGAHNVVITCLPAGVQGAMPAATVATDMQHTFRGVRIGLFVGVGSGSPSDEDDVRLGDVVVSRPTNDAGGMIQYMRGQRAACEKRKETRTDEIGGGSSDDDIVSSSSSSSSSFRFVRKGCLNAPPRVLLTAMASLEAEHMLAGSKVSNILNAAVQKHPQMKSQFAPPVARGGGEKHHEADQLFEPQYVHDRRNDSDSCCVWCDERRLVA